MDLNARIQIKWIAIKLLKHLFTIVEIENISNISTFSTINKCWEKKIGLFFLSIWNRFRVFLKPRLDWGIGILSMSTWGQNYGNLWKIRWILIQSCIGQYSQQLHETVEKRTSYALRNMQTVAGVNKPVWCARKYDSHSRVRPLHPMFPRMSFFYFDDLCVNTFFLLCTYVLYIFSFS